MSLAETSVEEGSSLSSQNKAEMGTAQFVKRLQYKHGDLILTPRTHIKRESQARWHDSPSTAGGKRQRTGVLQLASEPGLISEAPGSSERPRLKKPSGQLPKKDTQDRLLSSILM